MSVEENREIARIPYEAFNDRDFERVSSIVAPGAKVTNILTGETFEGPTGFRQYLQTWASAFPDARLEITNIVAGEHGAAVEFTGRGTNSGPLMTPIGEIPPTGRRGEQRFCDVYRITDGKIAGVQTYFDLMSLLTYFDVAGLMRQLRLTP
jgi:predicted ester cyclase